MRFNKNDFIQRLDRTAEKNPLLWLPCVVLLTVILVIPRLGEKIRMSVRTKSIALSGGHSEAAIYKPLGLRVLAMTLVVAFSFMLVPEFGEVISIGVFAEESDTEEFDLYKYIADDIIFSRADETNYYTDVATNTMYYYFNEFRPMAEIWEDCITPEFENSVVAWENANLFLNPGDIGKKAIDARGYYITILLEMMSSSFESETALDYIYNSKIKQTGKVYKYFSDFAGVYMKCNLEEFLDKRSYSEEEKELLRNTEKEWLKENKWLGPLNGVDAVMDVLGSAEDINDHLNAFLSYCQVSYVCDEWKEIIDYMYNNCDPNNLALLSALTSLKNYMESDGMASVAFTMLIEDGVYEFASWGIAECGKALIKFVTNEFPAFSGITIGASLGKNLSNMLFGTDKTVEEYHIIKSYNEILNLLKAAYKNAENRYKNNRTSENAAAFLSYVKIYFKALHVGNDYGKEFADTLLTGGIANRIIRSKSQYEIFNKNYELFEDYLNDAYNTITTSWIHNLYFDDPDLYEYYAPHILNGKYDYIDVTRIEFERDSVEWGLDDVEFNGANYNIYPEEATNKEVIITSTDPSVAAMDNYGNIRVFKAGTCQIKAAYYSDESIYGILNVTVVEGHGADSVALPDIIPIEPSVSYKDFIYTIDNNEVTITGYTGKKTEISIPDTIEELPVTAIGNSAFLNQTEIKEVIIPDGVILIGSSAFSGCSGLTNVAIPNNVTSIESYAFNNCKNLLNVNLPVNLKSLGSGAFNASGLTEITISISLESASSPFSGCASLETIVFETGMTKITDNLFSECTGLKTVVIPDSIIEIGDAAFSNCNNVDSLTIGKNVETIGENAFNGINIEDLDIKDSVKHIGFTAFRNCKSLRSVLVEASIDYTDMVMWSGIFAGCSSLSIVEFAEGVTKIPDYMLSNTSVQQVVLPSTLTSIGEGAFYKCAQLKDVIFPDNIKNIDEAAFSGCISLTKIIIPESLESIGINAFDGCEDTTVYFPFKAVIEYGIGSVKSAIGYEINNNEAKIGYISTNGNRLIIPAEISMNEYGDYSVKEIGNYISKSIIYMSSNLKTVVIENGIETIGDYAFNGSRFTDIEIPDSVTYIGEYAFKYCENLNSVSIPESITTINSYTFYFCDSLKSVKLPSKLKVIDYSAFNSCSSLETVNFPESLTTIGANAFLDCTALKQIIVPPSVTSIGNKAFRGSTNAVIYYPTDSVNDRYSEFNGSLLNTNDDLGYSLNGNEITVDEVEIERGNTEFIIPNEIYGYPVTAIGDYAFEFGPTVARIVIPSNISSIGFASFSAKFSDWRFPLTEFEVLPGNKNFKSVDGVLFTADGKELIAFPADKSGRQYTILRGTEVIREYAFAGSALERLVIPDSVTSIGEQAFKNCTVLTLYVYHNSYAETYAKENDIKFAYIDDLPLDDTLLDLIESSSTDSTLTIDTSKYGTTLTANEISAAKNKNLTLVINGNGFSWTVKAADLPNTSVDFRIISPSVNVDSTVFNADFDDSRDFDVINPSGAVLTYDCGMANAGKIANIFTVSNGVASYAYSAASNANIAVTYVESITIDSKGTISFVPFNNSSYFIAIAADVITDPTKPAVAYYVSIPENVSVYRNGQLITSETPVYAGNVLAIIASEVDGYVLVSLEVNGIAIENGSAFIVGDENVVITAIYDTSKHIHQLDTVYYSDETGHWFTCSECGERLSFTSHIEDDGTVTTMPDEAHEGVRTFKCSVCGYTLRTETIPVLEEEHIHSLGRVLKFNEFLHWYECELCGDRMGETGHTEDRGVITIEPTEESTGIMTYSCADCGYIMRMESIPALVDEHTHSFDSEWKYNSVTHWHECECGEKHDIAVHIEDGGVVTLQPTETSTGLKTYSCTVCGYVVRTEIIPEIKKEHTHSFGSDWKYNGVSHWHECECGEKIDVESHIEGSGIITVQPTEITTGVRTYYCTVCGYAVRSEIMPATGWDDPTPPGGLVSSGGSASAPAGSVDIKTFNVRVENRITGRTEKVRTVRTGRDYTADVGLDNKGYYANIYNMDDEFLTNAYIKNAKAVFTLEENVDFYIVIDAYPHGNDVSAAAGAYGGSVPIETAAAPVSDGVTVPAVRLPQIMRFSNKKRRYKILRRRKLDDMVFVY